MIYPESGIIYFDSTDHLRRKFIHIDSVDCEK